ncbi:toll/interleukin-1 receptor domain-containing protein [Azospirillum argentinense]|uniref:Toll/interleukin-1 receptor domain-containing protein n=1 Tax=Azospirillum brasilense TaxID=192 RepID=A0A4D8Q6I7_AZOBR|nr:toll/interleukin-1 receptor domain-containing protein [Azospirillum argentinense]QCO04871.1 toll/interleukin-1 receptor domain-containing protein [Azospirillum argentinense]
MGVNKRPSGPKIFVSFTSKDIAWARWVAWTLEENGIGVIFQEWDFNDNFVEAMDHAIRISEKTLCVLSDDYFQSQNARSELQSTFARNKSKLILIKVAHVSELGLYRDIIYADLQGCSEEVATTRLLTRVNGVDKVHQRPVYPGSDGHLEDRVFPVRPSYPTANSKEPFFEDFSLSKKRGCSIAFSMTIMVAFVLATYGYVNYQSELEPSSVPTPPHTTEELVWESPQVTVDVTEQQAESLLSQGMKAVIENTECFSPPPKKDSEKYQWKFVTSTTVARIDQILCNSGMEGAGSVRVTENHDDRICLAVKAAPSASGIYHCRTKAHIEVTIRRP